LSNEESSELLTDFIAKRTQNISQLFGNRDEAEESLEQAEAYMEESPKIATMVLEKVAANTHLFEEEAETIEMENAIADGLAKLLTDKATAIED